MLRRTCGTGGGPRCGAGAEHNTSGKDSADAALVEVFRSTDSGSGGGRCYRLKGGQLRDNRRMAWSDCLTFALSGRVGGIRGG